MAAEETPDEAQTNLANRWWVDTAGTGKTAPAKPIAAPVGSKFFRAGIGFEQECARDRLTSNNLKILRQAQPPEGGWAYVRLAETAHPEKDQERLRRALPIPRYARGVLVDSGRTVRVLVTGTPIGERVLEFTFGYAPSFDVWIRDEWVGEAVFGNPGEAIRAARNKIKQYLSPEEIARAEAVAARA